MTITTATTGTAATPASPLSAVGSVLAHQGGWDEILMVAGPLVVFGGVLYLANKRANEKLAQAAAAEAAQAGAGSESDVQGEQTPTP